MREKEREKRGAHLSLSVFVDRDVADDVTHVVVASTVVGDVAAVVVVAVEDVQIACVGEHEKRVCQFAVFC